MIRTGRISRCRSNPVILFSDKRLIVHLFIRGVSPKFSTHSFVQQFSKCFRQTICQHLCHDCTIIVMFAFKLLNDFFKSMTGGHGKHSQPIIFRSYKISEGVVWLGGTLVNQLPWKVKFYFVKNYSFIFGECGEKSNDCFSNKPVILNNLLQQFLAIIIQLFCLFTVFWTVQYSWKFPFYLPGVEKRRPVNVVS